MEDFSPPIDVDVVVVIARSSEAYLVEVGVGAHGSHRLEATARVPINPDAVEVNRVRLGYLLDSGLVIGQGVITQLPYAIAVEVTTTEGATASCRYVQHVAAHISQTLVAVVIESERAGH